MEARQFLATGGGADPAQPATSTFSCFKAAIGNGTHLQQVHVVSQQLLRHCSLIGQRHDILHILQRLAQVVVHCAQLRNFVVVLDQLRGLAAQDVDLL